MFLCLESLNFAPIADIDPKHLMVLPNDLGRSRLVLREQHEILHQVEQPRPVAHSAQHHFQRHPARLVLALDALNASPARTSKNRSQSAVSEPTRLSVPFEAMSIALNQKSCGISAL